ncbi:MAG: hypothetical protein KGZ83_18545 [Sulfuricella sp.]|nr:hypothetical protein [Sulfuricella sp.]
MKSLLGGILLLFTALVVQGATLYAQMPNDPPDGALPSQLWFDPTGKNNLDSDAIAYAAFTLTETATVTHVEWWGQSVTQGAAPPATSNGFFIGFYNQDPGTVALQPDLPQLHGGQPLAYELVVNFTQTSAGNGMSRFSADLATPVALAAGTRYFLSIADSMPVAFQTWGWAQIPAPGGNTFYYQYGGPSYSSNTSGMAFILGNAALAAVNPADCLFNWAESYYSALFVPAGSASVTMAPYYYRYYPGTQSYLGTSSADGHVYYLGPASNNALTDVGPISGLLATAGCQ